MGNRNKPIILENDMILMKRIAKHGFVDMNYIFMFAYPGRKKRTINDRICQLVSFRYLSITKTFIPPDYTTNYRAGYRIVSLGNNGIRHLQQLGYDVIDNIKAIQNASPYRMYHQVQVSSVCDIITEEYSKENSNWKVAKILNEREVYIEEAFNQPDALILFQPKVVDENKPYKIPIIAVFLEIERSYASMKSLERKIKGYQFSFNKGLYKKNISENIISHRVLFVAQTLHQEEALTNKLLEIDQSNKIDMLITGYDKVTNHSLEAIFKTPFDQDNNYKLLAKLQ